MRFAVSIKRPFALWLLGLVFGSGSSSGFGGRSAASAAFAALSGLGVRMAPVPSGCASQVGALSGRRLRNAGLRLRGVLLVLLATLFWIEGLTSEVVLPRSRQQVRLKTASLLWEVLKTSSDSLS